MYALRKYRNTGSKRSRSGKAFSQRLWSSLVHVSHIHPFTFAVSRTHCTLLLFLDSGHFLPNFPTTPPVYSFNVLQLLPHFSCYVLLPPVLPDHKAQGRSPEQQAEKEHLCRARLQRRKGQCLPSFIVFYRRFEGALLPLFQVGIGTCNIGGKGMTGYVQPKGYAH